MNRMRTIYGRKHDILLNELKKLPSFCRVTGERAGVHLLVEFENGMSEEEIISLAKDQRVKVYPLSEYAIGGGGKEEPVWIERKPTVILGYATLSEREIEKAAGRLLRAWGSTSMTGGRGNRNG